MPLGRAPILRRPARLSLSSPTAKPEATLNLQLNARHQPIANPAEARSRSDSRPRFFHFLVFPLNSFAFRQGTIGFGSPFQAETLQGVVAEYLNSGSHHPDLVFTVCKGNLALDFSA